MASRMAAIQAYSPRIKHPQKSGVNDLAAYISNRSTLNKGTVLNVLAEFHEAIVHFSKKAIPLKLDGLGIFKAGIDKNGNLRINFKTDKELTEALEKQKPIPELEIKNRDMIGKSVADYIARWNEEHPDDPVLD